MKANVRSIALTEHKLPRIIHYRGWIIERQEVVGFRLPWIAYGAGKGQYASDTLAGIKQLVRDREACND